MPIAVLAIQGDFREHLHALARAGAEGVSVRSPAELDACDGLILPGGESTTIGKLAARFGLIEAIRSFAQAGKPVFGTCAGAILLSNSIPGSNQLTLGLVDAAVRRNAYGRQVESFEAELDIPELDPPSFRGVFIRAPVIESVGREVEVLARFEGKPVLARQGHLLLATFHPELTDDPRVHSYFLSLACPET
jgi:5'-phosphate synthase pdxT subunit